MRRFVLPVLLALAVPGLAAAQSAPPVPGAPLAPAPALAPPAAPSPPDAPPPPAGEPPPAGSMMGIMQQKFAAANTSHDGHLTLAQAQTAQLPLVVKNFGAIDTANRGYVTFNDIKAWRLEMQAKQMEKKAAALRAQD